MDRQSRWKAKIRAVGLTQTQLAQELIGAHINTLYGQLKGLFGTKAGTEQPPLYVRTIVLAWELLDEDQRAELKMSLAYEELADILEKAEGGAALTSDEWQRRLQLQEEVGEFQRPLSAADVDRIGAVARELPGGSAEQVKEVLQGMGMKPLSASTVTRALNMAKAPGRSQAPKGS